MFAASFATIGAVSKEHTTGAPELQASTEQLQKDLEQLQAMQMFFQRTEVVGKIPFLLLTLNLR